MGTKTLTFILAFLLSVISNAQTANEIIGSAIKLVDEQKYDAALREVSRIDESKLAGESDSTVMYYNYIKGTCLYFTEKYEAAIPFLKAGLGKMEKMPHEDCNYLELIYGIGSCYNNLGQYDKAEEYFRRVMIRGEVMPFKCVITTQALKELVNVYKNLGYNDLADACIQKIDAATRNVSFAHWKEQTDALYDLANSYEQREMYDEQAATYGRIAAITAENEGKNCEDYLVDKFLQETCLHKKCNKPNEAKQICKEIIEIARQLNTKYDVVSTVYSEYLIILALQNDVKTIESILPEAVEYCTSNIPDGEQDLPNLYENIGNRLCSAGNYEDGVKYLEKEWMGKKNTSLLTLHNLGDYYYQSNPQMALDYYLQSEKQLNQSSTLVTRKVTYERIMYQYRNVGDFTNALMYAEKAQPYAKELDDVDNYASFLDNLAVLYTNNGRYQESENTISSALQIEGISSNEKLNLLADRGFIELKASKYDDAINVLCESIKMYTANIGQDGQMLETMYHNLGRAYMLKENYRDAIKYLEKSRELQLARKGEVLQRTQQYLYECKGK